MSADEEPARNIAEQPDSLSRLREDHVELMRFARRDSRGDNLVRRIRSFIDRVKAAGAWIDSEADRDAAQDIISYWSSHLFTAGDQEALVEALPILDPFDRANAPDLSRQPNPYHGLAAFSEDDAGRFFGRGDEVKTIVDKLHDQPVVFITGPAGSGKTSIVAAGIVPRLKSRLLDEGRNAVVLVVRPGADPFAALLRSIHDRAADRSLPELETWSSRQKPRLERAPAQLRPLLEATFPGRPVILVVDDFDQFLAACPDARTREQFAQALIGVCSDPRAPDRTIVIADEQHEHTALQLAAFAPLAGNPAARFVLPPFTAAEVRHIVEGGAGAVGLKFDDGIVEDLARDVAGDGRAPPTLQFILGRLWNEREGNRITKEAYHKVGKPREALKRTADAVFDDLSSDEQQIARKLFLELVQPTAAGDSTLPSGGNFIRRRIRRSALAQIGPPDVVARVVARYVDAGLIRHTAGIEWDDDRFDVPHEALATSWPRLRDWLQRERTDSEKKLQLIATARRWQDSGFETGYLLSGAALEEAEAYAEAAPELGRLVAMSHREERERSRRSALVRRVVIAVMAVLLALTVASSIIAVWKWREAAQEAEKARNLASVALAAVLELVRVGENADEGVGILPTLIARKELEIVQSILGAFGGRPERAIALARINLLTQLSNLSGWTGDSEKSYEYAMRAAADADDYVKENADDENGQHVLSESKSCVARLDSPEVAKSKYEDAHRVARKWASGKPDDDSWQQDLIMIEYMMGDAVRAQDPDQSLQWYKNGLALSEQRWNAKPWNPKWQRLEGLGHFNIGELHAGQNHLEEALAEYRIVLETNESLVASYPQNRLYRSNLSINYFFMGNLYKSEGNFYEALTQYQKALKLNDELIEYDRDRPDWQDLHAGLHDSVAEINLRQLHFDTALKEYDIALQTRAQLAEKFPDDTDRQRALAGEYGRIGNAHKERGDLREADDAYEHGIEIIDKFKPGEPKHGSSLEQTGKELQEKIESLPSELRGRWGCWWR
jgi:tetratricopeptide (TPR) repeat protein